VDVVGYVDLVLTEYILPGLEGPQLYYLTYPDTYAVLVISEAGYFAISYLIYAPELYDGKFTLFSI